MNKKLYILNNCCIIKSFYSLDYNRHIYHNRLQSPETAYKWINFIQNEIFGLDIMPSRFPKVDSEPWKTYGIRKINVKNFIVYYYIGEINVTVWVTAVFYARKDQINVLKNMPDK